MYHNFFIYSSVNGYLGCLHVLAMIMFFTAKDGEALYSQQNQDLELTVAQIKSSFLQNLGLKKVGKTIRAFRYDLN